MLFLAFGALYFTDSSSFLGYTRKKGGDSEKSAEAKVPWWCVKQDGNSSEKMPPPPTEGGNIPGQQGGSSQQGGSGSGGRQSGGNSSAETTPAGGTSRGGSGTSTDGDQREGGGTESSGWSWSPGFGGESTGVEGGFPSAEELYFDNSLDPYYYYYGNVDGTDTVAKEKDDSGSAGEGGSPGLPIDPFGGKKPVVEIVHECSCNASYFTLPQIPEKTFTCFLPLDKNYSENFEVNGVNYKVTTIPAALESCPKDLKQNEVYLNNELCDCGKDVYFDSFLQKEFVCPDKYDEQAEYVAENYKVFLEKINPGYCPGNAYFCPEGYMLDNAKVSPECQTAKKIKCAGSELDPEIEGVCNAFYPGLMLQDLCP